MITAWKRIRGSAAIIAGGVLVSSIVSAQAPMVQPDVPAFGLVGLAPASQFVRLNATNMRVTGMAFLAPPGTLTVGPCRVSLLLGDGQGGTLKRSDAHLAPGQSTSLDLMVTGSPASSVPGRVEILPAVQRSNGCILVPSVVISILVGSLTGYALSLWRVRGAGILFGAMMVVAFIPYQLFIYPLVRVFAFTGLGQSLLTIVIIHTIFGLPTMTLLFRNYFASLPHELFKAARVDGAGFYQIYARIMMPMATPMIVVAVILQTTGIWNDFILGLVFAGRDNLPMTVQLNNIVNSTQGERAYNVDMAATLLTALLPLVVYFGSGRWFVRGIAAGAVKG